VICLKHSEKFIKVEVYGLEYFTGEYGKDGVIHHFIGKYSSGKDAFVKLNFEIILVF
jgi:hypothetical protein